MLYNMPADIVQEATGPTGAIVNFTYPTATDYQGLPIPVYWSHSSGAMYPLGTTTVTCWATDSGGRTATATFTITVRDTTAPTIAALANITVKAARGSRGAYVTFSAKAYDVVDGWMVPIASPPSGSFFPLGTTTVTLTATDSHNNISIRTFTVTVTANTP